ncbi:MAG: Spy/CpxP family protein refolding chaperone [Bacteroidota bacterium]
MKQATSIKALWVVVIILLIANIFWGGVFLLKLKERKHHRHDRGSFMERRLGLSEQQKGKFEEFRTEHLAEINPIYDELRTKRKALYNFKSIDSDSLIKQQLLGEISALHQKTERLKLEHFKELNEVLDEDQSQQFERILKRAAGHGIPSKRLRKKRH